MDVASRVAMFNHGASNAGENGQANVLFSYCSFTPRVTAGLNFSKKSKFSWLSINPYTANVWLSNGVGTGINDANATYMIDNISGNEIAIAIGNSGTSSGFLTIDHLRIFGEQQIRSKYLVADHTNSCFGFVGSRL